MPHSNIGARAKPGSNSPANSPQKAAPPSPQFTESQQFSPPGGPDPAKSNPDSTERLSPEKLSLDATEPFPDGLFRVPIPNVVFGRMPSVSDSALRCLLALVHLSFRFDPAKGEWVHAGEWLTRSDVEAASGLSDQGTRNGLAELRSLGWATADPASRSHRFRLEIEVPARRFTYVPTALLEELSTFDAGTELRVVLAVLRGTWGWTSQEMDPQSGDLRVVHDRWAQLSNRELAKATGRSETAVTRAAKALQGEWLGRVRPGNGPHQYRFLPEAIGNDRGEEPGKQDSSFGGDANDLTPDRQNSDPPSFNKESCSKDKHSQAPKRGGPAQKTEPASRKGGAVPTEQPRGDRPAPAGRDHQKRRTSGESSPSPDFSDLSPEKRALAEKLANVGVWAGRIAEILSRFSRSRVRANFELYRQRAAEQTIRKPGAWLHEAITEGYALEPSGEDGSGEDGLGEAPKGGLPALKHKETVSEAKKEACVAQGIPEERFHRCLSGSGAGGEPQFMYFDPEVGRPTSRT